MRLAKTADGIQHRMDMKKINPIIFISVIAIGCTESNKDGNFELGEIFQK